MSQENVEVVRRIFDSINRDDLDAFLAEFHPDAEADMSESTGPYTGIYRGRDQLRPFLQGFRDAWGNLRWNAEEIIEVDEERLIAVNRVEVRGRGSGIEVAATGAQLWTFKEGKAARMKLYQSKADALEAAGLRE
jgi:ketosteroid isomerase-like protein